jgi:hypothetical protein
MPGADDIADLVEEFFLSHGTSPYQWRKAFLVSI